MKRKAVKQKGKRKKANLRKKEKGVKRSNSERYRKEEGVGWKRKGRMDGIKGKRRRKEGRKKRQRGVGTNSQRNRKWWTRKKRCGVKKERGSEGLLVEKEVGALKGNGEEMG